MVYNIFRIKESGQVDWRLANQKGDNALEALLRAKRQHSEQFQNNGWIYLVSPNKPDSLDLAAINGDTLIYLYKDDEFIPWDFHQYETYKNAPMELVDLGD